MRRRFMFTVIELLVVISVIAILAAPFGGHVTCQKNWVAGSYWDFNFIE